MTQWFLHPLNRMYQSFGSLPFLMSLRTTVHILEGEALKDACNMHKHGWHTCANMLLALKG